MCALSCISILSNQIFADSPYKSGDLNGDGEVTAEDALLILQNVTGMIDTFPVDEENNNSESIVANVTTEDCSEDITYDGSKAVELTLQYPVVEVPGNKNASKAINQTLQRVRLQDNVKSQMLDDMIDAWNAGASKSSTSSYDISYEVCRNSNILSLKVKMVRLGYMAVASIGVNTFNFDLSTGALIDMTDLTSVNNYSDFAYDFAAPAAYKKVSQYNVVDSDYDLINYLDDNWYLDSDGNLNYVFPSYSVAPGAYGPVEVKIGRMDSYMTDYYINLLK